MKKGIAIGALVVLFLAALGCGSSQQGTIVRDQSVALAAKLQVPLDEQDAQINKRSKEILTKTVDHYASYLEKTQEGKEVLKNLNLAIEGVPIPGLGVMYSPDGTRTTVQVPAGKKSLQFFTVGDTRHRRWANINSPLGLTQVTTTRDPKGNKIETLTFPNLR